LQLADEAIQFAGAGEKHFQQHRIIAGDTIAFNDVVAGLDVGVKFFFTDRLHFEIDKSFNMIAHFDGIHHRLVTANIVIFFQLFNPGRNRRGRKIDLGGQFFD
jgi:hypothetical protein